MIQEDGFGFVPRPLSNAFAAPREIVKRYTLSNKHGATVRLISWGASIQSIKVPNRDGKLADVVLGFDDMHGYLQNRHVGSMIGRVADCISLSPMRPNDITCPLAINEDEAEKGRFNGETIAFDNVNWQSAIVKNRVVMSHLSRANSGGYPGDMLTQVKYTWTEDDQLHIEIRATATMPTPVNLTNYCLFNLAGHGTGWRELRKHVVTINTDSRAATNVRHRLPTGILSPVECTASGLLVPTRLSRTRLSRVPGGGYNHHIRTNCPSHWCYHFHARILHPTSGRFLEVYSNHPGVRFYTANQLPDADRAYPPDLKDDEWCGCEDARSESTNEETRLTRTAVQRNDAEIRKNIYGKGGIPYGRHAGFAMSPQDYPANIERFCPIVLCPGKTYAHDMTYKFGVFAKR